MSALSKIKTLVPASSRSLHAMYHELGQMHGQMGEMWAEVGESRYMLYGIVERLGELERLARIEQDVVDADNRHMVMLWELYRREGERLPDAKRRFLTGLDRAGGSLRLYQLASAQLLAEFDAFCTEHGLSYWLVSGTLLGAVRHEGFIPWDDDLDVGMTRQDIERIILLAANDERFEVTVRYDYCVRCRQVRFRYADPTVPCFIDLFYFDPVAHLGKECFVAREAERAALEADLMADEAIGEYWSEEEQFVDDFSVDAAPIAEYFNEHVGNLYRQGFLVERLEDAEGIIWGIDNVNSGVSHHTWYLIPKEAVFPLGRMRFEGREAATPADADRCLRDIFGDYYDLPRTVGSYFNHPVSESLRDANVRAALDELAERYEQGIDG